jgi:MYXO-CTERM domain-containing protein
VEARNTDDAPYPRGECGHGEVCEDGLCVEDTGPKCGDGDCEEGEDCDGCPGDCGCGQGETCHMQECIAECEDACEDGASGCEGGVPWICALPPDALCRVRSPGEACAAGFVCDEGDGACVEEGPGADAVGGEDAAGGEDVVEGGGGSGGSCATRGSSPAAGALLLLALLGLTALRRRWIA